MGKCVKQFIKGHFSHKVASCSERSEESLTLTLQPEVQKQKNKWIWWISRFFLPLLYEGGGGPIEEENHSINLH